MKPGCRVIKKPVLYYTWLFLAVFLVAIMMPLPAFAEEKSGDDDDTNQNSEEDKNKRELTKSGFLFGSYGRVQVTDDTEGHPGRSTNITAHGSRIFEPSYGELDLSYSINLPDGFGTKVLFTLALFEPLAHYSADYGQIWAVRNMYAEAWGFFPYVPWLHVWAGSRMYRGDDIYLLDFWPLDNLNTVGGGLIFDWEMLDIRAHCGVSRMTKDYQFQKITIPGAGYETSEKVLLDRQRTIASGKATVKLENLYHGFGMKVSAYGEYHHLPDGESIPAELIEDNVPDYKPEDIIEEVPEDEGWVFGGQVGFFGFGPNSHVNLYARWAQDLAAYGEVGVPYGTNNDNTAEGATEFVTGLSANWESKWVGFMMGAYLRRFIDADVNEYDTDDFMEGVFSFRPAVYFTEHLQQGFEFTYQKHYPFGLEADSGEHQVSEVFQYSFLEIVSLSRGNYYRPQFRFVYTISQPNEAARNTYASGDMRRPNKLDHFIGFGVEWWFNSSTY